MTTPPLRRLLQAGPYTAWHTTRGECTPDKPYSGFNLCHYTGDDIRHTSACRESLARHFGLPACNVIVPRQTHSTDVAVITSLPTDPASLEGVDAVVTDRRGIIIGVNTADCIPLVLIDPVAGISGVAHAGWRGALNGVIENCVHAMITLGSRPADILAATGPSICVGCFEVGPEVAAQFPCDCVDTTLGAKPHVSLQEYTRNTLLKCGLSHNNITPSDPSLCTRCHPGTYWSARSLGRDSGRVYTFVVCG